MANRFLISSFNDTVWIMKRSLMNALARVARAQGLTQADLARRLGVSLPTLKRWLRGEGIDLASLEALLNELGLSLAEAAALVPGDASRGFDYTVEQEAFFARHPYFLAYFDRLLAGNSPAQIRRRSQISERATSRYLRKLAELGLIERLEGGRVRLLPRGEPRWRKGGPLSQRFRGEALQSFLKGSPPESIRFGIHRLLPDDARKMQLMINELRDALIVAESRAKVHAQDDARPWGALTALSPFEWELLTHIREV